MLDILDHLVPFFFVNNSAILGKYSGISGKFVGILGKHVDIWG